MSKLRPRGWANAQSGRVHMTSKRHAMGAETSLGGEPAIDAGDGFGRVTVGAALLAPAAVMAFALVGADRVDNATAGVAAFGACVKLQLALVHLSAYLHGTLGCLNKHAAPLVHLGKNRQTTSVGAS
jgi:hypothetical protein